MIVITSLGMLIAITYSFENIQKLNVARLNKFGFSKVPSCDTLCKSCYHISGRTVVRKANNVVGGVCGESERESGEMISGGE
jgi:hypothetical protein